MIDPAHSHPSDRPEDGLGKHSENRPVFMPLEAVGRSESFEYKDTFLGSSQTDFEDFLSRALAMVDRTLELFKDPKYSLVYRGMEILVRDTGKIIGSQNAAGDLSLPAIDGTPIDEDPVQWRNNIIQAYRNGFVLEFDRARSAFAAEKAPIDLSISIEVFPDCITGEV